MIKKRKKDPKLNKKRGNAWEGKLAKDLSEWIFSDCNVLKRHPSSGAEKSVYSGDIFPMKQISWKCFPFHIEAKTGYEKNAHPFGATKQILSWYSSAYEKINKSNFESNIWIIWKIPNKGNLFCIDYELKTINSKFKIQTDINNNQIFVYELNDVIKLDFYNISEIHRKEIICEIIND
jgi:hypothetical protein